MRKKSTVTLVGLLSLSLLVLSGCQGAAKQQAQWLSAQSSRDSSSGDSRFDPLKYAMSLKHPSTIQGERPLEPAAEQRADGARTTLASYRGSGV